MVWSCCVCVLRMLFWDGHSAHVGRFCLLWAAAVAFVCWAARRRAGYRTVYGRTHFALVLYGCRVCAVHALVYSVWPCWYILFALLVDISDSSRRGVLLWLWVRTLFPGPPGALFVIFLPALSPYYLDISSPDGREDLRAFG